MDQSRLPRRQQIVLGIDFDNTLVCYDELIRKVAYERGFTAAAALNSKQEIRDSLRKLSDGDIEWQKIQAAIYGPRILEAIPMPGIERLFSLCRRSQILPVIVSHKTEYAGYDVGRCSLRDAARSWMQANGFFDSQKMGLSLERVYFEDTKERKIARIAELKCTHFIDDLEEIFLSGSFPPECEKLLFSPGGAPFSGQGIKPFRTWDSLCFYLEGEFGQRSTN